MSAFLLVSKSVKCNVTVFNRLMGPLRLLQTHRRPKTGEPLRLGEGTKSIRFLSSLGMTDNNTAKPIHLRALPYVPRGNFLYRFEPNTGRYQFEGKKVNLIVNPLY